MTLSDDQRALLRLLAQREQGYEDIAALKGKSVAEVRDEVRDALAALDAPPPGPPPPPPPSQPEPVALSAAQPPLAAKPPARPTLPAERRRLVLIAGGALAIVAVVLIAIAILSDNGSSDASTSAATPLSESAAAKNAKVTKALLLPVNGGSAEGLALFGRIRKEVVLEIAAKGLEPAPKGKAYVVWLAGPTRQMVPIAVVAANKSGAIAARNPIPAEVLVVLAKGVFDELDISLVSAARYKAAFSSARKEGNQPSYTGTDVLRGKITGPIVEAGANEGS